MKKLMLIFLLLSSLFISACTPKQTVVPPKMDVNNAIQAQTTTEFQYAQGFADEAIAYFTGREFDYAFSLPLYKIIPLGNDNEQIVVEGVEDTVSVMLYRVAKLALELPDAVTEPMYEREPLHKDDEPAHEDETPQETTFDSSDLFPYGIPQPHVDTPGMSFNQVNQEQYVSLIGNPSLTAEYLPLVNVQQSNSKLTDAQLISMFFPDGAAPNVTIKTQAGVVTSDFRGWFISTAQTNGLLDSRLFQTADKEWSVFALMCSPSNGGLEFHVFDSIFILSEQEVGELKETVATSPKYNMICESYIYFDNGDYRAVYVTDPATGISTDTCITVSFSHRTQIEDEYETELEQYLAGIHNLSVLVS